VASRVRFSRVTSEPTDWTDSDFDVDEVTLIVRRSTAALLFLGFSLGVFLFTTPDADGDVPGVGGDAIGDGDLVHATGSSGLLGSWALGLLGWQIASAQLIGQSFGF
jgi:hypothetical protein